MQALDLAMQTLNDARLVATAAMVLLFWAGAGSLRVRRSGSREVFRGRLSAVACALVPLAFLAAAAPLVPVGGLPVIGVLGGAAFLAREALDPLKHGFWHHRRLQMLGALASVGLGGMAAYGAGAERIQLVVLAFAGLAYHRHLAGAQGLLARSLEEIDGLARKVAAQEAALRLIRMTERYDGTAVEADGLEQPNAERKRQRERTEAEWQRAG